jgi:hypothetical protein
MFKNIVPLNKDRHAKTRIKEITDFGFVSQLHIAYVTLHEFARAAAIFPIVFLEDKAKDEFRPVVLMGLNAGENLFVSADGKWNASYVPAIIRRYPFALAPKPDSNEYLVCLDEDSQLLSETEGNALFDDKGEPTQVIENVKRYLTELQQMDAITNAFCKFLAEHNMFTPLNIKVRDDAEMKSINGCYVINEQRLNGLSDERFLEIKHKQYLPAVYAHLVSLAQTERLVKFKDERVARK